MDQQALSQSCLFYFCAKLVFDQDGNLWLSKPSIKYPRIILEWKQRHKVGRSGQIGRLTTERYEFEPIRFFCRQF